MRAIWAAATGVVLGVTGCAATLPGAAATSADFTQGDQAMRISATSVVDTHLSPLVPVHLTPERGGAIAVTFARRGQKQATARLDPATLQLLSAETTGPAEAREAPASGATRVVLDGGRFIVCWTEQSADGGRHAMARLWAPDGHALGPAVAISPPEADVLGAPHATSTDGRHAVVTFGSTSGGTFELRAVALEDATQSKVAEMARR
jgi:hypothetical protein